VPCLQNKPRYVTIGWEKKNGLKLLSFDRRVRSSRSRRSISHIEKWGCRSRALLDALLDAFNDEKNIEERGSYSYSAFGSRRSISSRRSSLFLICQFARKGVIHVFIFGHLNMSIYWVKEYYISIYYSIYGPRRMNGTKRAISKAPILILYIFYGPPRSNSYYMSMKPYMVLSLRS